LSAPSDSPPDPETGRVIDPEVLAEHRARRAELTEEGLLERAQRAERLVVALELRLTEAEDRGVTAERERGTLAGDLERAERELATARQRELAEQRRRIELEGDVGGVVGDLEAEATRLRTEHRAAEERAAELTRALVRAHAEVDGARTRAQAAREEDERTLASQRERARAHVTRLQHELARQATVHDAVGAQIVELRGTLETVRARAVAELEHERRRRAALEARLEVERARFTAELARSEEVLRAELVSASEARLAAAGNELHAARSLAEGADAARRILEAELAERVRLEEPMREVLEVLYEELEEARLERVSRAERVAAVEGLVADLIATARGLRAGFERELEAEQTARRDAEAELARERTERAAGEQRATAVLDALTVEVERLRAAERGNPIYDALSSGPLVPQADHPALVSLGSTGTIAGAEPPAVVADLMRAAARLRTEDADPGRKPVAGTADQVAVEPDVAPERHTAIESEPAGDLTPAPDAAGEPELELAVDSPPQPLAPASPDPAEVPERAAAPPPRVRAAPVAPTAQPWLAPALVALAAVDAASAERVLVAALPVQATRVARDVEYDLELPATGRHRVRVRRHRDVVVATASAEEHGDAEFRLEGPVAALAPLAAGDAPRRLRGVRIRGRRRRLRRLLRVLQAPIGLPELQAAGARPRPGDLLALLCVGVPPAEVRGADFGVAYVVSDADGGRARTLVRAEPDGSLTAIPEAPDLFVADATVTVDADGLFGVLAGGTPVSPEGDAQAVATLQRWLRSVQGLPP